MGTEMVILNGYVYTVDPDSPIVEAVAISGNRIIAIGSNKEISKFITPSTTVISADHKLVLPGFNDAHLHFLGGGQSLKQLDFSGDTSLQIILEKLQKAAGELLPGQWITGRGWDHTQFNRGEWPNKKMLDSLFFSHPVFLTRVDGHIAWVNSAALQLANITQATKDPHGGEIVRDDAGQATGILKESAVDLVSSFIPPESREEKLFALKLALEQARQFGITSIQDNSGFDTLELYHHLADEDELTVRVSEWMDFNDIVHLEQLQSKMAQQQKYTIDHHITIGLLKGFVDGTLGSRTAKLFAPYSDDASTSGMIQYGNELNVMVAKADSLGLQIGLHCIGDEAVFAALNAYRAAYYGNSTKMRHRIEHAQVIRPEDLTLFAEYGVIASMQPTHCTSDLRWAQERLGYERSLFAYPWRSLSSAGARIAFGTDWPVEPLDPMRGIYSAVSRKNIDIGLPENGWFPEQCLTVAEAVHNYTLGSAFAEYSENVKGSITPGKFADIIILSKNIFNIEPAEILSTRIDLTIFDGEIVFSRQ
ncbi:MAG: amidohydrolase [Calditrichaeota bacterium]|nr:MAG: amidohydrolase [Calditrichota bacterium]